MNRQFVDATLVIPTLGRVHQSIKLHHIIHELDPGPRQTNFVFQDEEEWSEFINSSQCGTQCSSLIRKRSVVAARNFGITTASTKYIAFIDDDCRPVDDKWLSELIEPLTDRQVALVTGPVFGWDGASGNLPFINRAFLLLPPFLEPVGRVDSHISARAFSVAGGNFAARRLEIQAIRGFSTRFTSPCIYEETEMAIRLCRVFDKTIRFNAHAGVIHDQNPTGGMRSDNFDFNAKFFRGQRRVLLESVYGKSMMTEARVASYHAFQLLKYGLKAPLRKRSSP